MIAAIDYNVCLNRNGYPVHPGSQQTGHNGETLCRNALPTSEAGADEGFLGNGMFPAWEQFQCSIIIEL